MNDPHVVKLFYNLFIGSGIAYRSPPPVTYSSPNFILQLDNGVLAAEMITHCASAGSAIELVAPVLRSWEIQSSLYVRYDSLKFVYDRAEIIDRKPNKGNEISVTALVGIAIAGTTEVQVEYSTYPAPPTSFLATPIVELLWSRLRQYHDGKELLSSMAYFCLSVIQDDAKGRGSAATKYSIKKEVFDKLGELTSEVGDELSARKYNKDSKKRPYAPVEEQWIIAAVRKVIGRVAEYSADPNKRYNEITLADIK